MDSWCPGPSSYIMKDTYSPKIEVVITKLCYELALLSVVEDPPQPGATRV